MHKLNRRLMPATLASALLMTAGPAVAATRTYIVTDFDTVRLEAPIAVGVQTRRGATARGEGDADLLERIELLVQGRVLTIRLKPSPFEGRKSDRGMTARLLLTTSQLKRAHLSGPGTLAIKGMAGQNAELVAAGSGMLSAAGVDADTFSVALQGPASVKITGKARKATFMSSGSGAIDGSALTASDLEVTAQGTGIVQALATRSARVVAIGPASVSIDGRPACTVRHTGSGTVNCGGEDF
ncbi:MAG TPA: DUF2807 domain-containing protein [Sphingobium sp.]